MIEITIGSLEEQIIKILQKVYPITIEDLQKQLHVSRAMIERVLQKFQVNGVVRVQPLPDKTYIRLLRNDFQFVGGKRQQKIIKQETRKPKPSEEEKEFNDIMYS